MQQKDVSRRALWFGLWGGGVAWLFHLLLAWAIAEFGCVSEFRNVMVLGITGVAWLIIVATLLMLGLASAAVCVARVSDRKSKRSPGEEPDARAYVARAGLITSALFLLIILVQSVPIFFYLKDCGGM